MYLYDIDSNSLNLNPSRLSDTSLLPLVLSLRSHKELIIATLGGSSGAITISKILGKKKKFNTTVALIIGFASGYLSGYWIATLSDIQCDSSSTIMYLDKPDAWKQIEHDFLCYKLYELGVQNYQIGQNISHSRQLGLVSYSSDFAKSPFCLCGTPLSVKIMSLVKELWKGKDPKPADFLMVAEYESIISKLNTDGEYRRLSNCITALTGNGSTLKEKGNACSSLGFSETFIEHGVRKIDNSIPPEGFGIPVPLMFRPFWFENESEFHSVCTKVLRESIGQVP